MSGGSDTPQSPCGHKALSYSTARMIRSTQLFPGSHISPGYQQAARQLLENPAGNEESADDKASLV